MCRCTINADKTVVVCDSCATRLMMELLGMPLEQRVNQQAEVPVLLTPTEHHGMMSRVNGWLDELEVARR